MYFKAYRSAFVPDLDDRHVLFLLAQELVDVDLDRQAVAVPAGEIGRRDSPASSGT